MLIQLNGRSHVAMWPKGLGHLLDMSWYRTAAHREAEGVG